MTIRAAATSAFFCLAVLTPPLWAQQTSDQAALVKSASPQLRRTIDAIFLLRCQPNIAKGTAFLLDSGFLVTDLHEIEGCDDKELTVLSDMGQVSSIAHVIRDGSRDLALLVPTDSMKGGLSLSTADDPEPGLQVITWGFPLLYAGNAPLLCKGYIAGYRTATTSTHQPITHIVVNAAFNHGNSGGPLLSSVDGKVLGVVQVTYSFLSPTDKNIIDVFAKGGTGVAYSGTDENGKPKTWVESQLTAQVLSDFYDKTQVEIGEAISVRDLSLLIKDHLAELPLQHRVSR